MRQDRWVDALFEMVRCFGDVLNAGRLRRRHAGAPVGGSEPRATGNVGATIIEVQFDDWMYLMTDKVMLNKATMRKYGVKLGEVTLSFTKR